VAFRQHCEVRAARLSVAAPLGWSNLSGLCLSFGSPSLSPRSTARPIGGRRECIFLQSHGYDRGRASLQYRSALDSKAMHSVFRPVLKGIEGDDTDRSGELPDEIGDDFFEVGTFDFGFAINGTE